MYTEKAQNDALRLRPELKRTLAELYRRNECSGISLWFTRWCVFVMHDLYKPPKVFLRAAYAIFPPGKTKQNLFGDI